MNILLGFGLLNVGFYLGVWITLYIKEDDNNS